MMMGLLLRSFFVSLQVHSFLDDDRTWRITFFFHPRFFIVDSHMIAILSVVFVCLIFYYNHYVTNIVTIKSCWSRIVLEYLSCTCRWTIKYGLYSLNFVVLPCTYSIYYCLMPLCFTCIVQKSINNITVPNFSTI